MMNSFNDRYTRIIRNRMTEFEDRIYDIEDEISTLEENEPKIIAYLNDICCSMPLGMALRRYLCTKFSASYDEEKHEYTFVLSDDREVRVSDYISDDYDVTVDDVPAFTDIFLDINKRYNTDTSGNVAPEFTKNEAKRLIKVTTVCQRSKMFLISFALHMDSEEVHKFLTDVLAEQTYNYRFPEEIIAYYCQSDESRNSYSKYLSLLGKFNSLKGSNTQGDAKADYTRFAKQSLASNITNDDELLTFLLDNTSAFNKYSQTAYNEFMSLLADAMSMTKQQSLSNDEHISYSVAETSEQLKTRTQRINRSISLQNVTNTEELAREMLKCIPRATSTKIKDGKKIITNDFIPIYNGENGQKSKKVQTTTLPKDITMNLLMRDRLEELKKQKKPVGRKDLVFLKFYVFSLKLQEREKEYSSVDYHVFLDECNAMLLRCGMSRLYPANRFENLILLSLLASNPFEMFENIIEYSFIHEPDAEQEL